MSEEIKNEQNIEEAAAPTATISIPPTAPKAPRGGGFRGGDNRGGGDRKGGRPSRGPRENREEKVDDGIKTKLVAVNRVTKVVKGGRNMRFSALVVAGDGNGRVGVGGGKAAEVPEAVKKAEAAARRSMTKIALNEITIPHENIGKFGTSAVLLKPAPEGSGIKAGASVRAVVELAGIKNITTKMYGSRNPINAVKATFKGLTEIRSPEHIARLRGKTIEEILN